ncbi:hypothetical protein Acr_17g0011820 [Actinidia rufa]|uniref:Uncharacterized protein n=1 Tax=Actinidia rufa TaxID=165716 RepID=A0A7J0G496_9ERIC|nr:hypothetical protein Acr_17g0011820 [Actinidia rufa]
MEDKVTRHPSSLREDPSSPESSPSAIFPLFRKIMTPKDLEQLRKPCSIPSSIQIRLLEEGETIMSARPIEVAFYEAAFHFDIRLPIHLSIRMILHFYSTCPAQLVPNARRSVICVVVLWQYHKISLSLTKFRNLFGLYKNPKLEFRWLYFREFPKGLSGEAGAPRVLRLWAFQREGISTQSRSSSVLRPFAEALASHLSKWHLKKETTADGRANEQEGSSCGQQGISLKKLAQKVAKSKSESSAAKSILEKGVVIGEKRPREDSITSPSNKGKVVECPKGNKVVPPPEAKKKVPKSSDAASTRASPILKPEEGTSANLGTVLGPRASILGKPSVAEKILGGGE